MPSTRKKQLIILAEVLVGALLLTIVTFVLLKSHKKPARKCLQIDERPQLRLEQLRNVASADHKSLVGLSAYLEFGPNSSSANLEGHRSFGPFEVETVTLNPGKRASQELALESACNQVTLVLKRSLRVVEVEEILVEARGDNAARNCSTGPTGIYFGEDNGYVCYSKQALPCYARDKHGTPEGNKVADFVIEALRFEVNGEPKKIAAGEFSKPPRFCF